MKTDKNLHNIEVVFSTGYKNELVTEAIKALAYQLKEEGTIMAFHNYISNVSYKVPKDEVVYYNQVFDGTSYTLTIGTRDRYLITRISKKMIIDTTMDIFNNITMVNVRPKFYSYLVLLLSSYINEEERNKLDALFIGFRLGKATKSIADEFDLYFDDMESSKKTFMLYFNTKMREKKSAKFGATFRTLQLED